jgi:hypothetical protein
LIPAQNVVVDPEPPAVVAVEPLSYCAPCVHTT